VRIEPGNYQKIRCDLNRWALELGRQTPVQQLPLVERLLDSVAELNADNAGEVKREMRDLLWKIREPLGEGTPELRRSYEKLRNLALDNDYPRQRWVTSPAAEEVPNFQRVSDHFLRGGQPDQDGLNWLQSNQVDLIIDLRGTDRDNAWDPPTSYPIQVHRIAVEDFQSPELSQVEEFIQLADQAQQQGRRLFLHCKAGIGRTGLMTACWRISHGMSTDEALKLESIHSYAGTLRQEQFVRDFETYWHNKHYRHGSMAAR